jgi:hypothetical protein
MRRELRFKTLDEARAELARLENGPVETTGNWSYYQILTHCGNGVVSSMTSFSATKPWPWVLRRLIGPIGLGKVFKQGFIPPGVGVKKGVKVERIEGDEKAALAALRKALDDFEKHEGPWAEHPFFGKLDKKKWTLLTSLHLANHLGWAKPKE